MEPSVWGADRGRRLAGAAGFVEAAAIVCETAGKLGLAGALVLLHTSGGPPGLAIDSLGDLSDDCRLYSVSRQHWLDNPIFERLRTRLGVIGKDADDLRQAGLVEGAPLAPLAGRHGFITPLIGPQGWFGTALFACSRPPPIELERELSMLATQLSVWCTDRGIGVLPEAPPSQLGRRQRQIAQLAASGRTNVEIAEELGISINTVKVRLKQVFVRLAVNNRTELANVLRRLEPYEGIAEGITQLHSVTVTRAPVRDLVKKRTRAAKARRRW